MSERQWWSECGMSKVAWDRMREEVLGAIRLGAGKAVTPEDIMQSVTVVSIAKMARVSLMLTCLSLEGVIKP